MWKRLCIISLCLTVFAACDDEEENYPSIISEFVEIQSDKDGRLFQFTTDKGQTYHITNTLTGYDPLTIYRIICGYVPKADEATIYQLTTVEMLRDSTAVAVHDPIGAQSVWHSGEYINMQLAPLTQGGTHFWGYVIDSITPGHLFLSLHHNQLDDPTSYTENVYASIYLPYIAGYQNDDSITLTIETFGGTKQYQMK